MSFPAGTIKNEHFQMAKDVLGFCDFVGLQERFEEDVVELYAQLGLPRPAEIRSFLTGGRPAVADLEPTVAAAIREHNLLDIQLYEYARNLRERRRRARSGEWHKIGSVRRAD